LLARDRARRAEIKRNPTAAGKSKNRRIRFSPKRKKGKKRGAKSTVGKGATPGRAPWKKPTYSYRPATNERRREDSSFAIKDKNERISS